jgi:hypothetical protein
VYKDASKKPKSKNEVGYALFQTINCCVNLTQSMRFADDPVYGEIMSRLRLGHTTDDDLCILNSRLITPSNPVPDKVYIPFLTISQKLVRSLNTLAIFKHAAASTQQVHTFSAGISRSAKVRALTPNETQSILELSPSDTQFLPTTLNLFVGMYVMITTNINVTLGLVNGAIAQVSSIEFNTETDDVSCVNLHGDDSGITTLYVVLFFCLFFVMPLDFIPNCHCSSLCMFQTLLTWCYLPILNLDTII